MPPIYIPPKMLLHDADLDLDIIVPMPETVPDLSIGTMATAQVPDDQDPTSVMTVEGKVIAIRTESMLDENTGEIRTQIMYTLRLDDGDVIDCGEDEIAHYEPETNEFDAAYHNQEAPQEVTTKRKWSEADLLESQERAAGGTDV